MTNDEIIYNEVNAKYHTPEQRRAILALAVLHPGQFCRLPEGSDSPPNGIERQV